MNKPKRIRYKRRVVIYSALFLIIFFSIADYYSETYGLPDFAKDAVRKKLRDSGFDIDFNGLKCGLINGIIITDTSLNDSVLKRKSIFTAEQIRLSIMPSFTSSYFLNFNSFEVISGELNIPMFPEYGEESKYDILHIADVDARFFLRGDNIDIAYFTGKIDPFIFSAYGTYRNALVPTASGLGAFFIRKRTAAPFSMSPLIESIPYTTRAAVFRKLLNLRYSNIFSQKPTCSLMLNFDAKSFDNSVLKANIELPAFTYAGFNARKVDAMLSYSNEKLTLDFLSVKLHDNGALTVRGAWDKSSGIITGLTEGRLTPKDITALLKTAGISLPLEMQLTEPISFKLAFNDFSLKSKQSRGILDVEIPEVNFKGVNMYNIKE